MLERMSAVPYSQCGEPSRGSSIISVSIFASTVKQLEERFDYAKSARIISEPITEESNGRWVRRWKERRATLDEMLSLQGWNRNKKRS